jgi:hypothetical protein
MDDGAGVGSAAVGDAGAVSAWADRPKMASLIFPKMLMCFSSSLQTKAAGYC